MKTRKAKSVDGEIIFSLINHYAEQDKMLFRSQADIYENLQSFTVVEDKGRVVGCCALQVVWGDLAEIKSLAVDSEGIGRGAGKLLVQSSIEQAGELGLPRIFALTMEPEFFCKLGFEIVEKDSLPMKVWSDCAKCSKKENCDEIAVVKNIK